MLKNALQFCCQTVGSVLIFLHSLHQQNGDEEAKRHGGNALPRMKRLRRSGSTSFTQRQVHFSHTPVCHAAAGRLCTA